MPGPFPANLEPAVLWNHFDGIRSLPHGSGNEGPLRAHVLAWAASKGLKAVADATGNVVVYVPATPGKESVATTVLQGHLDMVCEKNADVDFDFATQGIEVWLDGDWLKARGTTLGADNGVGSASALALADDPTAVHGPLEILLTVDEETGMTGARELDASLLSGRRMLNLDTEEEGAVYIGCAGGGDVCCRFPLETMPRPEFSSVYRIDVKGLVGGHSGLNIHENRANAIKVLARVLDALPEAGLDFQLIKIEGGSKRNAIPREASCHIILPGEDEASLLAEVARLEKEIQAEFKATDPEMVIVVEPRPQCQCDTILTASFTRKVVAALHGTVSGVVSMSRDVPGLVETSNNLGVIRTNDDEIEVVHCTRSSITSVLEALRTSIRSLYELAGADVEILPGYPGWKPDISSPLLARALAVYTDLTGKKAEIKAVHAGLECGLLGEKVPGMDMISIGPEMHGVHSPDEKVSVSSTARYYTYLKNVLASLE